MAAPASAPTLGNNPLSAAGAELARAMRAVRAGLRLSLRTMAGRIGLPLVLFHVILTLFGSWLAPYSPTAFQSYPVEGAEAIEEAQSDPNFIAFSTTGRLPNDPTRLALIQFYESQTSAVDEAGVLDLDRARANLAGVEAGWTDDQKAYVDKQREQLHQLEGPSRKFWFGTDQFGRDIMSRVMAGATSLVVVSVAGAVLGIILGTVVGMTSGFLGGRRDEIIMRIMDGLMSFPSLLIALLVLNSLGPSGVNIAGTVGVVFMAPSSRVMRSVTLSVKSLEFVESARLRGEPTALHHVPGDSAERRAGARRGGVGPVQLRHPAGCVAGIPRPRRTTPLVGLGSDDQREPAVHRRGAVGCDRASGGRGHTGRRRQSPCRRH